jgi:hypothetical protein
MRSNQGLRSAAVLALLVFTGAASCLPSRAQASSLPLVQAAGPRLEAGGRPFFPVTVRAQTGASNSRLVRETRLRRRPCASGLSFPGLAPPQHVP